MGLALIALGGDLFHRGQPLPKLGRSQIGALALALDGIELHFVGEGFLGREDMIAVEVCKLNHLTQRLIYEICDMDDLTPSYSQTVRMRKLADVGALGEDAIREIMSEEKANQRERIVIYMDDISNNILREHIAWIILLDIVRMRKLADEGALCEDAIREIMSEEKANQRERIVIYMDDIRQYYPRNMLPKDIVADIKNLLHKRRLEQMRRKENRDAR